MGRLLEAIERDVERNLNRLNIGKDADVSTYYDVEKHIDFALRRVVADAGVNISPPVKSLMVLTCKMRVASKVKDRILARDDDITEIDKVMEDLTNRWMRKMRDVSVA